MTVGLSSYLASGWLNMLRAVAFTAPASQNIKLHTADPGVAAATAPSANTTRPAATMGAASGTGPVTVALSNTPTWASWAAGTETETHVSSWDASANGNFLYSAALTTPKTVANGDTLTLTSLTVTLAPIAA